MEENKDIMDPGIEEMRLVGVKLDVQIMFKHGDGGFCGLKLNDINQNTKTLTPEKLIALMEDVRESLSEIIEGELIPISFAELEELEAESEENLEIDEGEE